jgi:hypothetical protein
MVDVAEGEKSCEKFELAGGRAVLWRGDCLDVLRAMPDASVENSPRQRYINCGYYIGTDFAFPNFNDAIIKLVKCFHLFGILFCNVFLGFVYRTIRVVARICMPVCAVDLNDNIGVKKEIHTGAEHTSLWVADSSLWNKRNSASCEFHGNHGFDFRNGWESPGCHGLPLVMSSEFPSGRIAELSMVGSANFIFCLLRMPFSLRRVFGTSQMSRPGTKWRCATNKMSTHSLCGDSAGFSDLFDGRTSLIVNFYVFVGCFLLRFIFAGEAAKNVFDTTFFNQMAMVGKSAFELQTALITG